jgi:hypothetical protein
LVTPPPPPEPEGIGADPTIAALLDEAEDIINAVVDSTRAEVDAEAQSKSDGFGGIGKLKKFFNRGKG